MTNQTSSTPAQRGKDGALFAKLVWRTAYECGNPVIDAQHRQLFSHANELLTAVSQEHPVQEINRCIASLIEEVVQHFRDEEVILTTANFAAIDQHILLHRQLTAKAVALVVRFHSGTLNFAELYQFLAYEVVAQHMLGADREFFPCLATIPAQANAPA
ncbi:MAG: hemerythrin family protein [Rhodoferax sp.]|nr:hemerythrin family protein [Rhodoferax sp.]